MNKAFYIFLFLLCFCCETKSQTNLVYNGDFEIYDTCPTQASYPTLLEINKCKYWYAPTKGTSDYFNTCSNGIFGPNGNIWIPKNFIGYQSTYNGNGYVGLFAFEDSSPCEYREYIQTKLTTPLSAGKMYSMEYYVSLANHQAAVNTISALFTVNKISSNDNCFILGNPQINYSGGFILDTLGWTKVSGSFVANGGEEYLTIGYFGDTSNAVGVMPLIPDSISLGLFLVYYYIDGVSLYEANLPCDISEIPNIFTPNDDGVNDLLKFSNCVVKKISVFDRWGLKIFESSNQKFWDGRTTSGEKCSDGSYFYIIEAEEKNYKGFVQLMR